MCVSVTSLVWPCFGSAFFFFFAENGFAIGKFFFVDSLFFLAKLSGGRYLAALLCAS